MSARRLEIWEESFGSIPYKVTVFEMPTRKNVLYLRWRAEGNWQYESLANAAIATGFPTATLFDVKGSRLVGRALAKKQIWAADRAEAKFAQLKAGLSVMERREAKPLTFGETWMVVSDPETGRYIADSAHRREVRRELGHAMRILGEEYPWAAVRKDTFEKVWRTRIREVRSRKSEDGKHQPDGLRGAEITIARLLAIGAWLREKELIPVEAALHPKGWKKALRDDWTKIAGSDRLPTPRRPRHKIDELRKLLDSAWEVDPRLGLLLALGAELRGGQVSRARRTDLNLSANMFSVPGMGNKRGTVLHLTPGQRAAVARALHAETGYLRELEGAFTAAKIADYFLFPAGQMPGVRALRRGYPTRADSKWKVTLHPYFPLDRLSTANHAGDTAIRKWFSVAEERAGITHQPGRGLYGLRRAGVDAAKALGISREGLQELGGWSDSQIPDAIYADQQRGYARDEASKTRAAARGETAPEPTTIGADSK